MPYASRSQVEDYIGANLVGDTASIDFLLREATRDIDNFIGPSLPRQDDGTTFGDITLPGYTNPHGMTDIQLKRISDATCAQAEYRLQMGYDFFVEDQRESVAGPGGMTETGKVGRVGPKARAELAGTGLLKLTGRAV